MARLDVLRDFAALQMLIFRAVGLANPTEQAQMGHRETAFTSYVLSQIATKVGADNYEVVHADIKNSVGSCLGEIFAYNESANQEDVTGTCPPVTKCCGI